MKPDNVHKMAFVTPNDKHPCLRTAFGFCKAPQTRRKGLQRTFDALPRTSTYTDYVKQRAETVEQTLQLFDDALRDDDILNYRDDLRSGLSK